MNLSATKMSNRIFSVPSLSQQRGTTLIEALVAMILLALGMLGIAGLSMVSLRTTQESGYRSVASQAALEIADKLRTHWGQNGANVNTLVAGNALINTTATLPDCVNSTCDAVTALNHDVLAWAKSLTDLSIGDDVARGRAARLPSASAVLCYDISPSDGSPAAPSCDPAPGGMQAPLVVKIWWAERQKNADDINTTQLFATAFQL